MMRRIHLHDLKIHCIIGIHPHERTNTQDLFCDLDLDFDYSKAAHTENVVDTLDYTEIALTLQEFICHRRFYLLETLVEESLTLIFSKWPSITEGHITVKKPLAVPDAKYAAVSLSRKST